MHVVLVEPEIPQNAGNIARLCVATGCMLHLVRPLGFFITDRHLRRAGVDYWHLVKLEEHDGFGELRQKYPDHQFHFATRKASRLYTEAKYGPEDFLVFGRESTGLSDEILAANAGRLIRIPTLRGVRSLNLANAVAIVVYEALRQQGFSGVER
ncbi:MAG: tRNA (cytidine(34)-2'-O)-methyltransferase [Syntrophothermus sp.]